MSVNAVHQFGEKAVICCSSFWACEEAAGKIGGGRCACIRALAVCISHPTELCALMQPESPLLIDRPGAMLVVEPVPLLSSDNLV